MNLIDFGIIVSYLIVTIGVGLYYGRGVKTFKQFATGSGGITVTVLVTTILATTNGGNAFLGYSEKFYNSGLLFILVMISYPVYRFIMGQYIVPRMSPFGGALSVGDLMKDKFGVLGQVITGLSVFVKSVGGVSAQIAALSIFMNSLIGVPVLVGIISSSFIIVLYSAYGGIRSVMMTDVIQFCIMFAGIPIMTALSMKAAGGNEIVIEKILSHHLHFSINDFLYYISLFVVFSIPRFDPDLVQRLFVTKNLKKLSRSFKFSAYADIPFSLVVIFMVGSFMVLNPDGVSPNNIVPYLVETVLPSGARGFIIAVMMAAIMSTADSSINTGSVSFTNDVLKPLLNKNYAEKKKLFFARLISIFIGVFSMLSALYFKSIFDLYLAFLNVWVPVMVVPLYAVIFNHSGEKRDFIRSALGGILSWFGWKYFGQDVAPLHPILVSLGCSFLCFHWPKVIRALKNI